MKRNISILMIVVLFTISTVTCTNSDIKIEDPITQTDTAKLSQMVKSGEVYTCKMHDEVMGDRPGKCPKCGMYLVKQKITDAQKKMWKEDTYIKPNY